MQYINYYNSPLGKIILTSDGTDLNGLWFGESKNLPKFNQHTEKSLPIFDLTKKWLEIYFSGNEPDFTPKLSLSGTPFQLKVWKLLQKIPYGKTTTYGDIAKEIANKRGIKKMSAQAVGNAVGKNKISIIIPCHRVIGINGNLVGYAAGLEIKSKLLQFENSGCKLF